ncbi:HAD family hydrolase [Pseudofrankia sp. EUN1h]|nr:HAD family hydrolase [Pseudofrankia sp. EUN1h]
MDLAVFDIAGTTVEEHGAVYQALRHAVEAAGATPGDDDIERWMGADKRAAIRALLAAAPGRAGAAPVAVDAAEIDTAEVERVFLDFRDRLETAYRTRPPAPIPGVVEAFGTLRARGIRIALTTGFDRSVVGPLLASLGWGGGLLDAVVCADDVPTGRPAPYMIFRAMELTGVTAVARVLVAGDTVRDLLAGTNAGAGVVVGVLTGQVGVAALGAVRHTHLLGSVAEIPPLVTGPTG